MAILVREIRLGRRCWDGNLRGRNLAGDLGTDVVIADFWEVKVQGSGVRGEVEVGGAVSANPLKSVFEYTGKRRRKLLKIVNR